MRSGVKALLSSTTVAVLLLGAAACGKAVEQQLSAKDTVTSAVTGVSQSRAASFAVSLDSTVADLQKLEAAEEDRSTTSKKTFQRILDGDLTLTMVAPEGKTLGDVAATDRSTSGDLRALLEDPAALEKYLQGQGSTALAVRLGGTALVEFRSIGTMIYARADVPEVLRLAGEDPSAVDSTVSQLPPSLSPLAEAAEGKWLAVDLVEASRSLRSSGALDQLPTQELPTTTDPAAVASLLQSLRTAYDRNATIETVGEETEQGRQYRVTAPAKQVAQEIQDDLVAVAGKEGAADVRKAIAEVPDRNVSVDLWVDDERLRSVTLDLAQFAKDPGTAKAALNIEVDTDGAAVTAPEGANTLDVGEAILSLGDAAGAAGSRRRA